MGFFSDEELTQSTQIIHTADGTECERCGLYQVHKQNKLDYVGKGKKGIFIILDCPTVIEARQQSLERSAKVKQLTLAAKLYGINLLEDCYITYAVRCVSPVINGLPVPPPLAIENCRLKLFQLIKKKQPEAIFAFGVTALKTLIGDKLNKITVDLFRGLKIPDQRHKAWLLSTYGHDYIRTRENDSNLLSVWNRDIGDMFRFIRNIPPLLDNSRITNDIVTLTSFPKIIEILDTVIEEEPTQFYFDYETTGLKPHSSGHKITHVSFCAGGKGYSFPFQHRDFFSAEEQKQIKERLINILTNHNIWKSAHHCKFEQMWSLNILGVYPEPWDMDTLLASHIADNRRNFTGLKFQTYIVLGIYPYDGPVASYLSAEGGNSFNRVEEIPTKQALTYSALDSRYGYEVLKYYEELFMQEGNENLCDAYDLFHEGNLVFADMQENGMRVDEEHYQRTKIKLKAQIEKLYKKIDYSFESKEYQKKYGKYIDIDSPKELVLLFDGILKYDLPLTDKGNLSVDKEALAAINSEFTNTILEIRKLQKIVGTYIAQFERETANGVLRGSYNLNIPISYRSSASDPNMQNISVRDPLSKEACRGGLYAHKGHKLLEADYSGVEVSISACTHNDPNMITYIKDPSTDMHRDCYDINTRILTENGFKYYDEITEQEKIAQYNPETDKIEYVLPLKRICYHYTGEMFQLKNRNLDLLVTPNHRLYLKKIKKQYDVLRANTCTNGRYYFRAAATTQKVIPSQTFHFSAAYGTGVNKKKKYHESFDIKTNDMFELLGYLITDGHFKYHKQGAYRINLSQHKEPHRTKMKECIDRIKSYTNFTFHETKNMWAMSNKVFCNWLCTHFGGNKINRKLPDFIKYAPLKQLQIFFSACLLGDGNATTSKNAGTFCAISEQLVDDFQFICLRLGYKTHTRKSALKGGRTVQVYCININYKKEFSLQWNNESVKKVPYTGKVFCFTVPTGLLIVNRNSHISIQGNSAADLFLLEEKQVTKQIRQAVKGGWVFPQFYGSWYKECGDNLWKEVVLGGFKLDDGTLIAEHLKKNKIKNKDAFIKHCKKSENIFWNERFKVYAQWKKDINAEYRRKGFITNPFGFTFRGYMQEKDVTNYPIQSSAFHCLLWSLIRINKYLKKNDFKSKVLGQIHDSIILSVAPEEQDKVITVVNYIGTTMLQDAYPFIIVPMKIDFEITDVDKPWSTKKDIELTARHKLLEEQLHIDNETTYLQTESIWEEEDD